MAKERTTSTSAQVLLASIDWDESAGFRGNGIPVVHDAVTLSYHYPGSRADAIAALKAAGFAEGQDPELSKAMLMR